MKDQKESGKKKMWVCTMCGYEMESDTKPEICPVCGYPEMVEVGAKAKK
jgi:rubrerythrin